MGATSYEETTENMAKCSGIARAQGDLAAFNNVRAFLWPLAPAGGYSSCV